MNKVGLLRAVRGRVRGHGPLGRAPGTGGRRVHPRRGGPGRPGHLPSCAASTPTPGPRCSSPAPDGSRYEPTPGPRACRTPSPTPACREQQAAPGDPGGIDVAPTTTRTTAGDPVRSGPSTVGAAIPTTNIVAGDGTEATGRRARLRTGALRAPTARTDRCRSSLGVVLAVPAPVPGGSLLSRRSPAPAAPAPRRSRSTWPGPSPSRRPPSLGFQERPSDTYVERAQRLAAGRPGADGRRRSRWPPARGGHLLGRGRRPRRRRRRPGRRPTPIGAAARARTTRSSGCRRWFDPRPLAQAWRRSPTARQRQITMTPRGDLEAERRARGRATTAG